MNNKKFKHKGQKGKFGFFMPLSFDIIAKIKCNVYALQSLHKD